MKFSSIFAVGSALIASALSQDVGCFVDGNQVAVVDLDTGVCPFTIPATLPAPVFRFVDENDYTVQFYYAVLDAARYFTDIPNAGNVISIAANLLYNQPALPLFSVAAEQTPAANSTAALRRRYLKEAPLIKRETVDEFVAQLKELNGTELAGQTLEVKDPIVSTVQSTTISTVDTCSSTATAGGLSSVPSVVTTTISGVVTEYTTWCPISTDEQGVVHTLAPEASGAGSITSLGGAIAATVTKDETTIVTITSCENDKCHETAVPATKSVGLTTIHGVETVYTTWCPVSTESAHATEGKPVQSQGHAQSSAPAHVEGSAGVEKTITVTKPVATSVATHGTETSTTIVYQTLTTVTHESKAPVSPASAASESVPGAHTASESVPVGSTHVASASVPAGSAQTAATSAPAGVAPSGTHVTVAAQSSSAPASTAAISTFEGNAATYGASFLAMALVPLAFI